MNSLDTCFVPVPLLAVLYMGSKASWGWALEGEGGEAGDQPSDTVEVYGLAGRRWE